MTNLWKNPSDNAAGDEIVYENGEFYLKATNQPLHLFAAPTMEGLGLRVVDCLLRLDDPEAVIENMSEEFRIAIGL